jgi:DNA end-binding protein Ku
MRSLWNGSISFGLVNIPVKLYTGTSNNDIKFNYLHSVCHTPIKYQKTCPTCAKQVTEEEIVKGYEFEKTQYVIMDEADFEAIAPEKTRSIDILDFVQLADIDPIYFQRTYYLEPGETGIKAYHLLKRAMLEKKQIAIAKIVIRARESLAALRVYGPGLALETMYYPEEIRAIEQLTQVTTEPEINERELEMAMVLIDNLTTEFAPEKYHNEYQNMLANLIEQKVAGKEIIPVAPPPAAGKVIDLMAALEASVQATKAKSGQAEELPAGQDTTHLKARLSGRQKQRTEETG